MVGPLMSSLRRLAGAAVALLVVALWTAPAHAGESCRMDNDCPGDQLCVARQCQAPQGGPPTSCTIDANCPGDEICIAKRCAAAGQKSPACTIDRDCPNHSICQRGVCQAPPGPPVAPPPSSKCGVDGDCAGNKLCREGDCVLLGETGDSCGARRDCNPGLTCKANTCAAPPATPPPAAAPPPGAAPPPATQPPGAATPADPDKAPEEPDEAPEEPDEAPEEPASSEGYGGYRKGFKVGFDVSADPSYSGAMRFGMFGSAAFVGNIGVSPLVDLRFGLRATAGAMLEDEANMAFVGVPLQARFNLGSVYSMMVGGAAGMSISDQSGIQALGGYAGPEASVLSFRLGSKRQLELSLLHRIVWTFGDTTVKDLVQDQQTRLFIHNSLQFTYLFL